MRTSFVFLIMLTLLVSSCTKDKAIPSNENDFLSGKVEFSLKNGVTLQQSFNSLQGLNVTNYEMHNFYYTKVIPSDSMQYYFNLLHGLTYIKAFDIFRKPNESYTRFRNIGYENLTSSDYFKWDSIVTKENLIEMPDAGDGILRYGIIDVPVGHEREWIGKLKALPEIYDANYILQSVPFE